MPYLLLILTTLFWSGNFVLSRGMHAEIPPFSLSFWRWAVALLILSCFGLRHLFVQHKLAFGHRKFIIIQGVVGVAGFNTFIYMALQTTTAINAVLVNSCIPVILGNVQRSPQSQAVSGGSHLTQWRCVNHLPW